jgi:hypothetical protein
MGGGHPGNMLQGHPAEETNIGEWWAAGLAQTADASFSGRGLDSKGQ